MKQKQKKKYEDYTQILRYHLVWWVFNNKFQFFDIYLSIETKNELWYQFYAIHGIWTLHSSGICVSKCVSNRHADHHFVSTKNSGKWALVPIAVFS